MKQIISFLLLFFSVWSEAQEKILSDPLPYFNALIVNDLDNSIEWYTKNFGFEILNKVDMEQRGFKQANLKCGEALLELIEINTSISVIDVLKTQPPRTRIIGLFKFGFALDDFDEWIVHLKNTNAKFSGNIVTDPNSGKKTVIILDPDGNRIQLFEK